MSSLNPIYTVGQQLCEILHLHNRISRTEAMKRAQQLLEDVQIPEPGARLRQYPHQLSGGQRQRVMIAMALANRPDLLIADEPTTALDVTVQAQILDLMRDLKREFNTSIVLITHDLGVIAGLADRVMVMYAGSIVEEGAVRDIFKRPQHPYTEGLLKSMPRLDSHGLNRLETIGGQPPNLQNLPTGCSFRDRCQYAFERCAQERPLLHSIDAGRAKACHLERSLGPLMGDAA
jgi:oligopeptide transport system ATP-binding protein